MNSIRQIKKIYIANDRFPNDTFKSEKNLKTEFHYRSMRISVISCSRRFTISISKRRVKNKCIQKISKYFLNTLFI